MPLNNSIKSVKDYFSSRQGIQRANRYSLSFSGFPEGLSALTSYLEPEYISDEILIGERAIDHVSDNLPGYGLGRLVPRRQRFANGVTIVFPVAGNNKILKLFDTWFQAIYGVGKNGQGFYVRYYDDTVKGVTLRVKILNLNGNTVSQFRFTEVFPTQSLPVKFSSAGAEPYLRYGVTFNYREQIHEFEND